MRKVSPPVARSAVLQYLITGLLAAAPQLVHSAVIEEIVVTAQKRAESIQDVPISVTAFDAQALEARQITSFGDLQFNVPNVSYSKTFFSGNNFQIRGIGTLLTASSADSGVAVHVNDVYLNAPLLFETEFYDVEQMEILRGPQGTLFGRNATGGAVNLKTARPELGELYGDIEGELGNHDHIELKGAINIPLGERVAGRIAGILLDRDGFSEDTLTGDDLDGRDQWSVRGSLRFDIADGTRLDIIGHTFEEDSNRSRRQKQLCNRDPSAILGCTPDGLGFGAINTFATLQTLLASNLVLGPLGLFDFFNQPNPGERPSDLRKQRVLFQPEYEAEEDFLMAEFSHDLTDTINWTLIAAMQDSNIVSRQDFGTAQEAGAAVIPPGFCAFSPAACTYFGLQEGGPAFLSTVPNPDTSLGAIAGGNEFGLNSVGGAIDISRIKGEQWSMESRFTTSFDGPVNFLLGGYYMEYEHQTDYFVQGPGLDYPALVLANSAFAGNPDAFVSLAPAFFNSDTDAFELDSLGIFGETYWDINDRVKLTFGLRYTQDDKFIRDRVALLNVPVLVDVTAGTTTFLGSDGSQTPVTTINELMGAAAAVGDFDADPNVAGGQAFRETDLTFDEFTGRIVLDWKPDVAFTDDTLVYFSFSRGFKGGGINPPVNTALTPNIPESFDPEEIDAYEVGTKNTFWGRRAQFNASLFYYDYTGLQIGTIINRTSVNTNTDAEVLGAEAEFLLQPNENWQFNAQLSYLDTELGSTTTIDPRDPTQGRQDVTLIKDFTNAAHCVVEWNGQGPLSSNAAAVGALSGLSVPYFPTGQDLGAFGGAPGAIIPTTPNVPDSAFSVCAAVRGVAPLFGYSVLDSVGVDLKGNELIAPDFTVSLGAQHTWFLNSGMSLTARADYYWQDEFYSSTFNRAQDLQDSWGIINAQVQLNGREDRWFARAFVQNLGDEDNITGTTQGDPSTGLGTSIFLVEPRLFGLTIGARFN